jgi:transketolase
MVLFLTVKYFHVILFIITMHSIRKTISNTLFELAVEDQNIVALTADLAESVGFDTIREKLPKQFVEIGIAEQELASLSAGFALSGMKPLAASYASFNPGRNWDQIRTSICYNHTPVRLLSSHYGLNVGGDGATHQCLEYLALTLCLPHLRVLVPFNNSSAKWSITEAINENHFPSIVFQPRADHNSLLDKIKIDELKEDGFVVLKNELESKVLIITTGLISSEAMQVFDDGENAIDIVFMVDLTTYNQEKLAKLIYRYNKIIILEEHQEFGGLGSLIFGIMAKFKLAKDIRHLCIKNKFGKSARIGTDLWDIYQISAAHLSSHIID